MVFDHVDVRVPSIAAVRPFYDAFLKPFGFRGKPQADGSFIYVRIAQHAIREGFALIEDPQHRPNATRLAFAAPTAEAVDRIAEIARRAGALAFEAPAQCPEIAPHYYAAFFEDPAGNRLEVVNR